MNVKETGSFTHILIDIILPFPLIRLCSCEMIGDARRVGTIFSSRYLLRIALEEITSKRCNADFKVASFRVI